MGTSVDAAWIEGGLALVGGLAGSGIAAFAALKSQWLERRDQKATVTLKAALDRINADAEAKLVAALNHANHEAQEKLRAALEKQNQADLARLEADLAAERDKEGKRYTKRVDELETLSKAVATALRAVRDLANRTMDHTTNGLLAQTGGALQRASDFFNYVAGLKSNLFLEIDEIEATELFAQAVTRFFLTLQFNVPSDERQGYFDQLEASYENARGLGHALHVLLMERSRPKASKDRMPNLIGAST